MTEFSIKDYGGKINPKIMKMIQNQPYQRKQGSGVLTKITN